MFTTIHLEKSFDVKLLSDSNPFEQPGPNSFKTDTMVTSEFRLKLQSISPALSTWLHSSGLQKKFPICNQVINSSNMTEPLACHLLPSFRPQTSHICSSLRSMSLCSGWHERKYCVRQGTKPKACECLADMNSQEYFRLGYGLCAGRACSV